MLVHCFFLFVFFFSFKLSAGELPSIFESSLAGKFYKIGAGSFLSGEAPPEQLAKTYNAPVAYFKNEWPPQKFQISVFFMAELEVSQPLFQQFLRETLYIPQAIQRQKFMGWKENQRKLWPIQKWPKAKKTYPLALVTYKDAKKFIVWLNKADKTRPKGWVYDLPSENQWEYVCKGGKQYFYPWGNKFSGAEQFANGADLSSKRDFDAKRYFPWDDGYARLAPSAQFKATDPGIFDLAGNQYEWAHPRDGDRPILKGGSWHSNSIGLRCAKRKAYSADFAADNVGLRLVININQ